MEMPNPSGRAGAGGDGYEAETDPRNVAQPAQPDNRQPIERHDPLCDDKVALFEVRVPIRMLLRLAEHFRRPPVRGALP